MYIYIYMYICMLLRRLAFAGWAQVISGLPCGWGKGCSLLDFRLARLRRLALVRTRCRFCSLGNFLGRGAEAVSYRSLGWSKRPKPPKLVTRNDRSPGPPPHANKRHCQARTMQIKSINSGILDGVRKTHSR